MGRALVVQKKKTEIAKSTRKTKHVITPRGRRVPGQRRAGEDGHVRKSSVQQRQVSYRPKKKQGWEKLEKKRGNRLKGENGINGGKSGGMGPSPKKRQGVGQLVTSGTNLHRH